MARVIPLWLKVSYTAYVVVLVPVYWVSYGPANFLWFSDLAFLGNCVVLWRESRYLASMIAVGTIIPEIAWNADFFFHLVAGRSFFNISNYMFDPKIPLYLRALSGFHLLLPPLEFWLLYRLGYALGAWKSQALVAACIIPFSRLFSTEQHNVNWVYGPSERQSLLPDPLYVASVVVVVVAGFILPAHLLLKRLFRCR